MCLSFLITGTGTVRWRADGAALGSQSEPSTSYHIPVYIATEFFIFVSLPTTTGGGGSGRAGGGGLRGAVLWSHTRALLHNQTMHYRYKTLQPKVTYSRLLLFEKNTKKLVFFCLFCLFASTRGPPFTRERRFFKIFV